MHPLPENEHERLKELKKYSFLDALPEKDLDDLTKLASEICQTPIALIALIDEKKQWYKSRVGVDSIELDRDASICTHTLLKPDEVMQVPDLRLDERFKNNPNVANAPYVVFYAGVSLVTSTGYALGTLSVIDVKPRKLDTNQLDALRIIANQTISLFELRRSVLLLKDTETRLSESNEEMRAFTHSVSHDLRAPMRSINSYATILLNEYADQLEDDAKHMFGRIGSEARRMGDLIDDLLTFSRLSQVKLRVSEVDMTRLATRVSEKLTRTLDKSRIEFKISPLPSAKGDTAMLELVWQNLIDNALKFSSKKSHSVIEIGSIKKGDTDVYFIRDNGAGFDMKYVHKLFGVFERLYGWNEFEGTGVGLAIIKRILERHGARIWAEGALNEGATFYFLFTDANRINAAIAL